MTNLAFIEVKIMSHLAIVLDLLLVKIVSYLQTKTPYIVGNATKQFFILNNSTFIRNAP